MKEAAEGSWLRDPAAIYRDSFATIRIEAAADLQRLPPSLEPMAVRLMHACGMTDLGPDLAWNGAVDEAARSALAAGAPILTDARMVAAGIITSRLPQANRVQCFLEADGVAEHAQAQATTRSAAAIERWADRLAGAVVTLGNAPTALFRLLELLEAEGAPRPAALFAFPVGFIGAAESKEALVARGPGLGLPFLTLRGRRGGSALAAAAVNALYGNEPGSGGPKKT